MAYLRIRNGYGYICKKVKKKGLWKEETIVGLGKIKSEEDKERMQWIAKKGMEGEIDSRGEDILLNDLRDQFDLRDKAKGKELEIKRQWSYPADEDACEEFEREGKKIAMVQVVGLWCSTDEKRNKMILTPIVEEQ